MPIFEAELHAFKWDLEGKDKERGFGLREINVPDNIWKSCPTIDEKLDQIWHYGQNDFQPRHCRSLSVGDIITLEEKRYVVLGIGFKEVPKWWVPPCDSEGRMLFEGDWKIPES